MQVEKFSMTMMVMDKKWIYSFGGATMNFQKDLTNFEIERLDTEKLGAWERIVIECDMKSCCQQGVIPLNPSWGDKPGERRYLVFGGVHGDYTRQTFIFNENLHNIS